jgi:putative flavoprotein involved in K+ transport
MIARRIDTVVIGGGKAGLAMSYCLTQRRREHIVLEEGRVAESWRSKRWDSLCLVGPNWTVQLPGFPYQKGDPDGYMSKDEVTTFLERYAQSFGAPVRTSVRVTSVDQASIGSGYVMRMDGGGTIEAANVVVATGEYQMPKIPASAATLPSDVVQIAAFDYRHPGMLPPGAVLVVGSGESGCQIAEELRASGRSVYLSTGTNGWVPRQYRGKNSVWWIERMGRWDHTVDDLPPGRPKFIGPQTTGKDGGHDLNLHTLARAGVTLLGRVEDIDGPWIRFAPDLHENVTKSDAFATAFRNAVDECVQANGIDVAPSDFPRHTEAYAAAGSDPIRELNVTVAKLTALIWATGYRPDFGWLRLPVLDEQGYPVHKRGVSDHPGLYFLGFDWLYKRKSGLLLGVGEDAEYLSSCIQARG